MLKLHFGASLALLAMAAGAAHADVDVEYLDNPRQGRGRSVAPGINYAPLKEARPRHKEKSSSLTRMLKNKGRA
jgi:hypothetical protein